MLDSRALKDFIADQAQRESLPGLTACLMGPDGTAFEFSFGRRDAAGTPADMDTVFGIASLSKSITALALSILAAEGRLDWDDPVAKYFPQFRVPGAPRDMVTLRTLARHTSGLPPMEPLEWSIACNTTGREADWIDRLRRTAPNPMATIEQVIDYIAACPYPAVGMPGEVMSYSNEGYAVLSWVFDRAAGVPLEDFCAERIFAPLGMTRTVMDDDCAKARAVSGGNITSLFEDDGAGGVTCDDAWSVLPPFRGCAMVKSTARDLARYYRCLASGGAAEGRQVLPREAVEMMIGPSIPLTADRVYGLGLYKYAHSGHTICDHGGGLHGVSSKGALLAGEGWGAAVLCNKGDASLSAIEWALLNAAMGQPLDTPLEWYAPAGRDFSDPQMLTGRFVGHEGDETVVEVAVEHGRPVVHSGDQTARLTFCGENRFAVMEGSRVTEHVAFFFRDGRARAMRYGSRVLCAEDGAN